jgi:hypothetical protein
MKRSSLQQSLLCTVRYYYRLSDKSMSIFWRLLRPEFVRERGSTLLGTATAAAAAATGATTTTTTTTHITADATKTTTDTVTSEPAVPVPAVEANTFAVDAAAVAASDICFEQDDKIKVMKLIYLQTL